MTDSSDVRRREEGRETKKEVVDREIGCSADENALVLDLDELSDDLRSPGQRQSSESQLSIA